MDLMTAVMRIEAGDGNESEEDLIEAWQYIKDSGAWRTLQGFYGRTVQRLTEEGVLT